MYTHPTLNCNQYSHFIERWLRRFPLTLRLISTPMISRRGLVPVSYTSNLLGDKAFVIRSYHSILSLNNTFKQYRIWESYRFIIIPPSRHLFHLFLTLFLHSYSFQMFLLIQTLLHWLSFHFIHSFLTWESFTPNILRFDRMELYSIPTPLRLNNRCWVATSIPWAIAYISSRRIYSSFSHITHLIYLSTDHISISNSPQSHS